MPRCQLCGQPDCAPLLHDPPRPVSSYLDDDDQEPPMVSHLRAALAVCVVLLGLATTWALVALVGLYFTRTL